MSNTNLKEFVIFETWVQQKDRKVKNKRTSGALQYEFGQRI